jgi:hypothetical protein
MSRLIAILYSVFILIQSFNINFEDISKFKILLNHVNYHAETYGDSFVDFLSEHYGNTKLQDSKDHKEHNDLPFKDCKLHSHIITSYTLNTISYDIGYINFIEIPIHFLYKESTSLFEKLSVFQPPQFI